MGGQEEQGKKLKLYVWHDVLRDYSSGVLAVYAASAEDAKALCLKAAADDHADSYMVYGQHWDGLRFDGRDYKEYDTPTFVAVFGGG